MAWDKNKKGIILGIIISLFLAEIPTNILLADTVQKTVVTSQPMPSGSAAPTAGATATASVVPGESVTATPTGIPVTSPVSTDSSTPTESPSPTDSAPPDNRVFSLLNKKVTKVREVKNKVVSYRYKITSYVTDEVVLKVSKKSSFQVYGEKSKKLQKKGIVKLDKTGKIRCTSKARGNAQSFMVQVTEEDGEGTFLVTIHFEKKLENKGAGKCLLYQGRESSLRTNYKKSRLTFTSSNKKVATVDKTGRIIARRNGKSTILVKVKDSEKNQFKVLVTVKEEPWIVNVKDTKYTYEDMTSDLKKIAWKYRGKASLQNLGSSEDGRAIWCLRIGNPRASQKILINGGIHAREWLNCLMLTYKSEEILREYVDYKSALRGKCVYIVPMINPDGVTISQSGFDSIRNPKLRKVCKKSKSPARTWKGNARGVNLNFNFSAGWNPKGKAKKADGLTYPGKKAVSEKETKVMTKFVNSISGWKASLNYHSTGSILYWNYNVESQASVYGRQKALATKVNQFTHYRLMPKSISTDPNGGFGDWLIYNKKIPNVTIETGSVMAPLPYSQFKKIFRENSDLLSWFVK